MSEMNIGGWVFEGNCCYLDLMIEFQSQWKAMDEPFAVVGMVVTGPSPGYGEVLEFAALQVNVSGLVTAEFSKLVSLQQPVLDLLLDDAGIAKEEVDRDGHPFAEVMKALTAFLHSRPVFVHDAEFDQHLGVLGRHAFTFETVTMSMLVWPTLGSQRINDLAALVGAPMTGKRAIDAAKATLAVLLAARAVAWREDEERQTSRDSPD